MLSPTPPKRFNLVLLGDSLTQGYGLERRHAFPSQLQSVLDQRGAQIDVHNAGVSGETSAQGLKRFDAATKNADGVVIQFGGNDMLQAAVPRPFKLIFQNSSHARESESYGSASSA
jgi:lysophospholipase L1-like esterase